MPSFTDPGRDHLAETAQFRNNDPEAAPASARLLVDIVVRIVEVMGDLLETEFEPLDMGRYSDVFVFATDDVRVTVFDDARIVVEVVTDTKTLTHGEATNVYVIEPLGEDGSTWRDCIAEAIADDGGFLTEDVEEVLASNTDPR